MNPSEFTMLENRIMDWYESLNESNTLDSMNMRTRIPPFLNYTDNNGYSYKADNGNIVTFSSEEQSVIRELINDEIDRLNNFRNNSQQPPPSVNYLNSTAHTSMEFMGGRRRRRTRRTRGAKKAIKAKRRTRRNKRVRRGKRY